MSVDCRGRLQLRLVHSVKESMITNVKFNPMQIANLVQSLTAALVYGNGHANAVKEGIAAYADAVLRGTRQRFWFQQLTNTDSVSVITYKLLALVCHVRHSRTESIYVCGYTRRLRLHSARRLH